MMELSRHIECLLTKHNCVIIPEFGGFVTQYMPARLIKEENLFLPPYRSIGFNPALTHNDGLLIQSYMQTYDTGYSETLRIINNSVHQLKSELQENGVVEISGIGRLLLGTNGRYDFEPYESGVVSPELYGLDSFTVAMRSEEEIKREKAQEKKQHAKSKKKPLRILRKSKRSYMLAINREIVNYAAAAIVAIAFYFAWTAPTNNATNEVARQASVFSVAPSQSKTVKVTATTNIENTIEPAAPVQATGENAVEPTIETEKYTIVLMSYITKKNANAAVETFKVKGCPEVHMMDTKVTRVAFGTYTSREAAEADLRRARECTSIPDAWIMKIKQ